MLTAEKIILPLSISGEKPDEAWLGELLKRTKIGDRRSHRPSELSGGEQQRRHHARARLPPTVVFADEPTGNLDSKTSGRSSSSCATVENLGQTTVMVTHDARAAAIADRILFLNDGRSSRPPPSRPS
jgi:putative ABC transport system ATP-binding protein